MTSHNPDTREKLAICERLRHDPWPADDGARTEAADTIEALVEALGHCRDRFTEYAREHQRKAQAATHPRDHDERMEKANRNLDMAMVCETALSRARNGGQP